MFSLNYIIIFATNQFADLYIKRQKTLILCIVIRKECQMSSFFENYGNDFYLHYGNMRPGFSIPAMHIHPSYEVMIVPKRLTQKSVVNGLAVPPITEPSLTIFSPYTMHQTLFDTTEKTERFVFYFGEDFIAQTPYVYKLFSQYKNNAYTYFELSDNVLQRIEPFLVQAKRYRGSKNLIRLIFLSIFYIVLRHSTAKTVSNGTNNMSLLSEIIQYMAEHCCEGITADSVSRHFSISRSKLNKDFYNELSISFHDILTEMKISKACYLLENNSISISEISDELGFKDETYFFTFFKRNTGMTPSQFRKERRYIKDN